ncbi:MAG: histidine phosphatase family protein, partial [Prochlorotrichaceae cyanobacterium]
MPPTLLLIRHGQTLANAKGQMHTADLGLTPLGFQQAQALIPHCQHYGIGHLLCSSAQRALQTAQAIATALNLSIQTTPLLQERNWGAWSGRTWVEVQKHLDGLTLEERFRFRP